MSIIVVARTGYVTERELNEEIANQKVNRERLLVAGTWAAFLAALVLAVIEYVRMAADYHWWPFCH